MARACVAIFFNYVGFFFQNWSCCVLSIQKWIFSASYFLLDRFFKNRYISKVLIRNRLEFRLVKSKNLLNSV